jgi:pimeloyl-ACP methyl ester carboxylesterase
MQQTQSFSAATEHDFTLPTGHRMHYRKVGSGPPLLFIHGLAGSSFSWRFNLPVFASLFTCYAVDLLGMGDSDRPLDIDVSPRALGEGLLAFMLAQGHTSWYVIGSSHGGGVAMWIARLASGIGLQVDRLVLVAPINPWSAHGRRLAPFAAHPVVAAIVRASPFSYVPVRRFTFGRMYGDPHRVTAETLAGYSRPLQIKGTVPHCLALLHNWNRNVDDLEAVMRDISIPVLLVWGTSDRLVYLSSAQRILETMPNARLVKINGAGHLPYEEDPAVFNPAVASFLTGME